MATIHGVLGPLVRTIVDLTTTDGRDLLVIREVAERSGMRHGAY